jgi:hypothetical protein
MNGMPKPDVRGGSALLVLIEQEPGLVDEIYLEI